MNELARAEKNKALRNWRKQNPEKVKAAEERYWMRRAEKTLKGEPSNERNENDVDRSRNR